MLVFYLRDFDVAHHHHHQRPSSCIYNNNNSYLCAIKKDYGQLVFLLHTIQIPHTSKLLLFFCLRVFLHLSMYKRTPPYPDDGVILCLPVCQGCTWKNPTIKKLENPHQKKTLSKSPNPKNFQFRFRIFSFWRLILIKCKNVITLSKITVFLIFWLNLPFGKGFRLSKNINFGFIPLSLKNCCRVSFHSDLIPG